MKIKFDKIAVGDWIFIDYLYDVYQVVEINFRDRTMNIATPRWLSTRTLTIKDYNEPYTLVGISKEAKHNFFKRLFFPEELLHKHEMVKFTEKEERIIRLLEKE